jgi:hypothetical protein
MQQIRPKEIKKQDEGNNLNRVKELERKIYKLEQELRVISSDCNSDMLKLSILGIIKRNYSNEDVKQILKDILPDHKIDFFNLLMSRIESLEIQNFNLIRLNEQYVNQIKTYIDVLVENLDTLTDMQNVVNQVYAAQAITKKFLAIRDTLNEKEDFITKQKNIYLDTKAKLECITLYNQNQDLLLCKDKHIELNKKSLGISTYDEDVLLHDNYILKTNNVRLRSLLIDILKENNINAAFEELNYHLNSNYDVILSGDLFYMLNSQAKLIEDNLFK